MVARPAALPPRLLRAVEAAPAATRLKPAVLLSLQAFDAAVRLNSFKAAAAALHLTPSAISHRIRNLERVVGSALFTRAHRSIEITPAGRALALATGRALAELARATLPPAGSGATLRLRLDVSPLFCVEWLMPRLPRFMAAHPDIELVLESSTKRLDFENEAIHAGVRVGDGSWKGLVAQHLMDLHATPVATPSFLSRLNVERPADLARVPTIHVNSFPLAWPTWLHHAGSAHVRPRQAVWVDNFEMALQLAARGGGVALGLSPLFAGHELAKTLQRPFAGAYPTGGYWLVHRPEEDAQPALRSFKRWLRSELARQR